LVFLRAAKELRDIQTMTGEKSMYESREKAILDYESSFIDALQPGEAIGIEKGRVQLLQELLGGTTLSSVGLITISFEELTSTTQELQAKLRERNAE
jgi:hypothetical protein